MLFFLYDYYIYISFDQTVNVCNKVHHFTYFYKKTHYFFYFLFVEKIAFKTHFQININFSDKLLQNKFCSLILFCWFTYLYLFFTFNVINLVIIIIFSQFAMTKFAWKKYLTTKMCLEKKNEKHLSTLNIWLDG